MPSPRDPGSAQRPAGCICDGSGFAIVEVEMTNRVPVYDGIRVVGEEEITCIDKRAVRCPVCRARDLQASLARMSGLTETERRYRLGDVAPNGADTALMLAMAARFIANPWGMWTIWGTYGNAKTMVLQAIVNEFREQGQAAVYVRFPELLEYLRAAYDRDRRPRQRAASDEEDPDADLSLVERYRRIARVKLLAIDEVGKDRVTEFAREFRSTLFDSRWRYAICDDPAEQRHTLIATNEDPAGLPGDVWDRLRHGSFGCWLPLSEVPNSCRATVKAQLGHLTIEDGHLWVPGITRNNDPSMRPAMPPRRRPSAPIPGNDRRAGCQEV